MAITDGGQVFHWGVRIEDFSPWDDEGDNKYDYENDVPPEQHLDRPLLLRCQL